MYGFLFIGIVDMVKVVWNYFTEKKALHELIYYNGDCSFHIRHHFSNHS